MARRWSVNEKIYVLYWSESGISPEALASDLRRPLKSVSQMIKAWEMTAAGRAERARLIDLHKRMRQTAVMLIAIEDDGVNISRWLNLGYSTNDWQSAEMPEHFPPLQYRELRGTH